MRGQRARSLRHQHIRYRKLFLAAANLAPHVLNPCVLNPAVLSQPYTPQAELNVYEEFATVHCAGRVNPPVVCAEAEEAVLDLKHSLQMLSKHTVRKLSLVQYRVP
jgi:hypothetical protein